MYYALGLGVLEDTTQFMPVNEDDKEGCDVAIMQASHNRKIKAIASKVTDKEMKIVIKELVSPPTPLMPSMTAYPKLHKNPVTARPVISNIKAPHSRSSKWAARALSGYVGLISDAHIKSTRDFYMRVKMSRAKGRLLSLDIKSLFTNIPVDEAIEVVRTYSTGPDPTFNNLPIEPDLFCDILKLCTSYNQFTFGSKYYRQISGVPMGSSLSPILANLYMEHFEANLLEDIPVDLRPTMWLRYVDDIFCCYEDMNKFEDFLERLNGIRPSIQFTHELSRTDRVITGSPDLPANVTESLPFLEFNVMRQDNASFIFSIYRKPCHAGNYLHAYSYQPLFQKTTVIRSLYLRAYRYCDVQFLAEEFQQIKHSFSLLGYTREFIEKCRISAHKGRMNEIKKENLLALQELPFANHTVKLAETQEPLATLALPYHPCMLKLRPRLTEMGIRVAFSSNSSIGQQLRRKSNTQTQPRGSVYVINCSGCNDVYVGQTGLVVQDRMDAHARNPSYGADYSAIHQHNTLNGHQMDLFNPTQVFHSDCKSTRCTVEAALIHSAPTILHNTASASIDGNDLVAPAICRATKFNWTKLSECIPNLNIRAIRTNKKHLFGSETILRPPPHLRTPTSPIPIGMRTRGMAAREALTV